MKGAIVSFPPCILVSASTSTPAAATAATLVLLLLILQEILRNTAEDGTSDRAQETMTGLFPQVVATKATTEGT